MVAIQQWRRGGCNTAMEKGWLQYNDGEGVVAIQQWRRGGCNKTMEKGWLQYNNREEVVAIHIVV